MTFKKTLLARIVCFMILISCEKTPREKLNLTLKIKGFKKGTAFLEAQKDSVWVPIDSFNVLQKNEFVMGKNLPYPQILRFSIGRKKTQSVYFFAENKPMILEASLEKMNWKSKVSGSQNDSILKLFERQMKQLRFKRLELLKEKILSVKAKDNKKIKTLQKKELSMLKNEYLFGINFVAQQRNYEVAPYIATTYLKDVNNKFLQKILDTLPPKIKKSFYGGVLQKLIVNRENRRPSQK